MVDVGTFVRSRERQGETEGGARPRRRRGLELCGRWRTRVLAEKAPTAPPSDGEFAICDVYGTLQTDEARVHGARLHCARLYCARLYCARPLRASIVRLLLHEGCLRQT